MVQESWSAAVMDPAGTNTNAKTGKESIKDKEITFIRQVRLSSKLRSSRSPLMLLKSNKKMCLCAWLVRQQVLGH